MSYTWMNYKKKILHVLPSCRSCNDINLLESFHVIVHYPPPI